MLWLVRLVLLLQLNRRGSLRRAAGVLVLVALPALDACCYRLPRWCLTSGNNSRRPCRGFGKADSGSGRRGKRRMRLLLLTQAGQILRSRYLTRSGIGDVGAMGLIPCDDRGGRGVQIRRTRCYIRSCRRWFRQRLFHRRQQPDSCGIASTRWGVRVMIFIVRRERIVRGPRRGVGAVHIY